MKAEIEITRTNVTLSQFFAYVKAACEKKGYSFDLDMETFENPSNVVNVSATVKDGIKRFVDFECKGLVTESECDANETTKWEIYRCKPLNYQTYYLNFDGTVYNEVCEFTFDDEKKGYGYYYQASEDNL